LAPRRLRFLFLWSPATGRPFRGAWTSCSSTDPRAWRTSFLCLLAKTAATRPLLTLYALTGRKLPIFRWILGTPFSFPRRFCKIHS
jgi:hypothetical protein